MIKSIKQLFILIEKHMAFIMPLFITYTFSVLFLIITYYSDKGVDTTRFTYKYFLDLLVNSIVPTTITYILCEVLHGLMAKKIKQKNVFWIIITIIFVSIYEVLYLIYYLSSELSWFIVLAVFTIVLIVLNAINYKKLYNSINRGHSLV